MHRICTAMIALLCFALALHGCTSSLQYDVSSHYNKLAYKRVGLLVVRVGNQAGCFGPVPITLQYNYANRLSEKPSGFFVKSDTHDVYLEEEGRLRESLPSYPYCSHLVDGSYVKFFGNITPQLSSHIGQLLGGKGYEVVDLRKIATAWDKPISEMTVDELLGRSRGTVDAVFILHYSDRGDFLVKREGYERASGTGFSHILYAGAMFDVATKERTLSFDPRFLSSRNIVEAIAHDPEILADPARRGKVIASDKEGEPTRILFSDEEVVQLAAKYICHGAKWGWNEWTGLDVIVP